VTRHNHDNSAMPSRLKPAVAMKVYFEAWAGGEALYSRQTLKRSIRNVVGNRILASGVVPTVLRTKGWTLLGTSLAGARVGRGFRLHGYGLTVGRNVTIGRGVTIFAEGAVHIGDDATLEKGVSLSTRVPVREGALPMDWDVPVVVAEGATVSEYTAMEPSVRARSEDGLQADGRPS
jgi:acetyltransferase-like isoleucine patch superfamily enzyme